jgi:hypothetical protein
MLDAIVSIKTFWNATFGPWYSQVLSCNFFYKPCGRFKTFKQLLQLRVRTGTMTGAEDEWTAVRRLFAAHLHPSIFTD